MVAAYKLAYKPSLTSRHIPVPPKKALAIDMTITWTVTLTLTDNNGKARLLNPGDNTTLWEIGATFGVIKLRSDAPHWSSDGR
jgi:hypothetical protein